MRNAVKFLPPKVIQKLLAAADEEKNTCNLIHANLLNLATSLTDFNADLTLFGFARNNSNQLFSHHRFSRPQGSTDQAIEFVKWSMIAARSGALDLYNFGRQAESVRDNLHHCPAKLREVDKAAIGAAIQSFESHFPSWIQMRHSASHLGDILRSHKMMLNHTLDKSEGMTNIIMGDIRIAHHYLRNDEYFLTWKKRNHSYKLNQASAVVLEEVYDRMVAAFDF